MVDNFGSIGCTQAFNDEREDEVMKEGSAEENRALSQPSVTQSQGS